MFGCISTNFSENIFWCLEKKKENTNPEKHKPQPRKKSSTTSNQNPTKCIKSGKRNQTNDAIADQPKPSKMHQIRLNEQRRAVRSPLVDRRAMRLSERAMRSRRSRRSSIDERCNSPDDRTARSHRSRSSIVPLVGAMRSSDERRDRRSMLSDLGSLFSLSLSLSLSGN